MLSKVRRIYHSDQQVGHGLAGPSTEQHIAYHLLVDAAGIETVGTRKIEHANTLPARGVQRALFAFDGNPGVVGDLLSAAGQQIEERRLTAVGIADERDERARRRGGRRRHGAGSASGCVSSIRTQSASCRRRANVEVPTRTAIGSPPNGPRATTRKRSPTKKPSSDSRCPSAAPAAWRGGSTAATYAVSSTASSLRRNGAGSVGSFIDAEGTADSTVNANHSQKHFAESDPGQGLMFR